MKKKYRVCTIIAAFTILVSIITMSAVNVSAEQGSMQLEYKHVDPAAAQGSTDGTTQGTNTPNGTDAQTNAKTGDISYSVAVGLSLAAVLSGCTAWFTFKKKKAD